MYMSKNFNMGVSAIAMSFSLLLSSSFLGSISYAMQTSSCMPSTPSITNCHRPKFSVGKAKKQLNNKEFNIVGDFGLLSLSGLCKFYKLEGSSLSDRLRNFKKKFNITGNYCFCVVKIRNDKDEQEQSSYLKDDSTAFSFGEDTATIFDIDEQNSCLKNDKFIALYASTNESDNIKEIGDLLNFFEVEDDTSMLLFVVVTTDEYLELEKAYGLEDKRETTFSEYKELYDEISETEKTLGKLLEISNTK